MTELPSIDADALAAVVGGEVKRIDVCPRDVSEHLERSRAGRLAKHLFCMKLKGVMT